MRRALAWLAGATFGTAVLLGVKAQGVGPARTVAETPTAAPGSGEPATTAATKPTAPPKRSTAPTGRSTRPAGTTASAAPRATGSAPAPKKTTAAPPPTRRTITGAAFPASGFGNMQVNIVVTGTHIDSIATIQVSNRPGAVVATLTPQALAAQSADVGNVSGATYSSQAWKQSLRSAIGRI
jgi:uncharacterized protein with FMN-binding domain